MEREQRLKEKQEAHEQQLTARLRQKQVRTATRVDIGEFTERQDRHVMEKRENRKAKADALEKKRLDGLFTPAISEKSREIIAERTAEKGGETTQDRLMTPTAWSQAKRYVKGQPKMPVYRGLSKIPVRNWDGVDQWTGEPVEPTRRKRRKPRVDGSTKKAGGDRSRTPPRPKTPARPSTGRRRSPKTGKHGSPKPSAAEQAALQEAAAAHGGAREELAEALGKVQQLSEAATTQRPGAPQRGFCAAIVCG